MEKMRATVFRGAGDIRVEEVERPHAGVGQAVIRVTLTTICGTDLHIVRGEYPVKPGLVIGHEPVGVIEELGPGVAGYETGDRVLVGAITPCGQCRACLSGQWAQCGHGGGYEAIGGWQFGNEGDAGSGWTSPYHFGINLGPVVLMCENYRSGLLWRLMRACPYVRTGLRRAGFTNGWL